jgi:hypothetical protein
MFQIDDEYLKELGRDNLPAKEKADYVADIRGAVMEKTLEKLSSQVPNLEKLLETSKREVAQEIKDFHALESSSE